MLMMDKTVLFETRTNLSLNNKQYHPFLVHPFGCPQNQVQHPEGYQKQTGFDQPDMYAKGHG